MFWRFRQHYTPSFSEIKVTTNCKFKFFNTKNAFFKNALSGYLEPSIMSRVSVVNFLIKKWTPFLNKFRSDWIICPAFWIELGLDTVSFRLLCRSTSVQSPWRVLLRASELYIVLCSPIFPEIQCSVL